jgi:HK97 family phage major capsid protein
MNLREQRLAAIQDAQSIIAKARAGNRGLTASERETVSAKQAEVESLNVKIARSEEDADLLAAFNRLDNGQGELKGSLVGGTSARALSFKGVADRIVTREGSAVGIKALLAGGTSAVPTSDVGLIVLADRPATSLLDAVPAMEVPESFSYLRETTRTNLAAPVAVGALKPTSIFTLTRVESKLRTVAHLSEPIPESWLEDAASLKQFVENELVSGLAQAVTAQFLTGNGVDPNLHGVTLASGIQTQGFVTDMITTVAFGISKLETLGQVPGFIAMNPTDWVTIMTTRATANGQFLLSPGGAPVDSVRRQLWGVPVALEPGVAAGTAWVVGQDATMLFHDGEISVRWNYINDDFAKNQIRGRVEGRFQAGAIRPSGLVSLDLTA